MKDIFSPEDFDLYDYTVNYKAAAQANLTLNELIESWPVGYLTEDESHFSFVDEYGHTKKCRLAFIEELPKEPCKHEPMNHWNGPGTADWVTKCKHCGVELVAEWKEKT